MKPVPKEHASRPTAMSGLPASRPRVSGLGLDHEVCV